MNDRVAHARRLCRIAWIASWAATICVCFIGFSRAQTGAPTPGGSPRPESKVTSSESEPTSSRCEDYVAVFTGTTATKKDDPMLADPKFQALAGQSFDLLACRAVATDSDAPCALIPKQEEECRYSRSVFHELRTNPNGRSFMFPDLKYEMCRTDPKLAPFCDRLRDAARSGDPSKCKGTGDQEAGCRAAIALDESLCGKTEGCKKAIEANRVFAKGLKALAESGPARERALAKAALGDADACTSFAEATARICSDLAAPKTPTSKATTVPAPSRSAPAGR